MAKKSELNDQLSRLSRDLVKLGKANQWMANRLNDLNINRDSLSFAYEANITELLVAMDAKIETKPKLFSETFFLRGFPFYLLLTTFRTNVSYLAIFLKSQIYPSFNQGYDADRPFALQYELSILSHCGNPAGGTKNKTVKGDLQFKHLPYVHGWTKFATLTELMAGGLVKRNAIKLQATLKAYPV